MSLSYRVVDLRGETIVPDVIVDTASSPEEAARQALGVDLVRTGQRKDLHARVYFQHRGQPLTMVRLYRKAT